MDEDEREPEVVEEKHQTTVKPEPVRVKLEQVEYVELDELTEEELAMIRRDEEVRKLLDELRRLRQERVRDLQQQKQSAAHKALMNERQSLQEQQHAEISERLAEMQQLLEAEQAKASTAAAESADWKRKHEVAAAEGAVWKSKYEAASADQRRLRDETGEYSKRLLDVVKMASGAINSKRPN